MKKNRKRIVAAFMTVLMALTLVPTWLLGGTFATTAKAAGEKTYELDGRVGTWTAGTYSSDELVGEIFGIKGVNVKAISNSSRGKKFTNNSEQIYFGDDGKVFFQITNTKGISFTVPTNNEATVTIVGAVSNGTSNVDTAKLSVKNSKGVVAFESTEMLKGGSNDATDKGSKQGCAASYTVKEHVEAGEYTIYSESSTTTGLKADVYYVKVETKSLGAAKGTQPVVSSVSAKYNETTGTIDVDWTASTAAEGDGAYEVYVNGGEKPVTTVKADEAMKYSYKPSKSGSYTFTVKGVLGDEKNNGVTSSAVSYTLPLGTPSLTVDRDATDGTKIKLSSAVVTEGESYVFHVYGADGKTLIENVNGTVSADGKSVSAVAEGLTEGSKYFVDETVNRGTESKTSEKKEIRPYKNPDKSTAIPGMSVIEQTDGTKSSNATIVRNAGTIKVSQNDYSKVASGGMEYNSIIAGAATTGNFTITADVKLTSMARSAGNNQQGIYVGAFGSTAHKSASVIAAELGTNSKGYTAYNGEKKIARSGEADIKFNQKYTLTCTREGSKYTTTITDEKGNKVVSTTTTTINKELAEGKSVTPGISIVGAGAEITNVKITSGDTTLVDSTKFEGTYSPFINNWSTVDKPVITDVTATQANAEAGKIYINVSEDISVVGAAEVDVDMIDYTGKVVDTQTASTLGTKEEVVEFTPKASGSYIFKAYAKRPTETTKIESDAITVSGFVLPLEAPKPSARTAESSKVEVYWDAVPEATSYKVEYKKSDAESFEVVTNSTTATSAKTVSLTVGATYTFRVTAMRSWDGSAVTSSEMQYTVADHEQFIWRYTAFGSGVTVDKDNLSDKKKSADGYSGSVNEGDGKVNVWSLNNKGKLVPASTDGVSFYYSAVPTSKNFTLTATANINSWTYTNGQEGFGLMAADAVGDNGDSSVFWNNSYMASVTKVEYYSNIDEETGVASVSKTSGDKISMKLGIGSQEKIGVTKKNIDKLKDNDTDTVTNEFKTSMTTLDTSKLGSEAGTYNLIGNYTNTDETFKNTTVANPMTSVKLTIRKNNTGYFVSYTDAAGNTTTKKYYDTEALSQLDEDNVYIGLFASRTCDVTFSDISLTTINPEDDDPKEERPMEYKDVVLGISSASTASTEDYKLKGLSNVDGHVVVTKGEEVVGEADVKADEAFTFDTKLKVGDNKYTVTLTPDSTFKFDEYEMPTSYDPIEISKTVTYAYFTGDLIYVSAEATAAVDEAKANETYSSKAQINSGKGTKSNPIDIYNAVAYAKAGQKILLLEGDYKVANNLLIPFGINGTSEKPIYMMPEKAGTRVVLDFKGTTGEGLTLCGNYWYIQNIDVTHSANGKDGIHVAGSYNVLDCVDTYENGNTGIQISRFSNVQAKSDWPAYNTIKNCTSHNNADAGYEDADGFAAKLTIGKGNVFLGCIAHNNADDGWDLFAKVETGNIPTVVIMNCVAYANGFLEDGTNAGNGNGFKMGGSSLSAGHVLLNSVAFDNKAKGIDSNSCPDNVVVSSTSYNNFNYNVGLYTNDSKNTNYNVYGVLSYRNKSVDLSDSLKAKGTQDEAKLYQATDYYWKAASGDAKDSSEILSDSSFASVNTYAVNVDTATALADNNTTLLADTESTIKYTANPVNRNADGTISMNGLMMLTAQTRAALGAGVGADSLDRAPQLTAESRKILIDALGEEEFNRIASMSFTSPVLSRDGEEGALTKDSSNMALMMVILMASVAAVAGVVVFEKKRRMAR